MYEWNCVQDGSERDYEGQGCPVFPLHLKKPGKSLTPLELAGLTDTMNSWTTSAHLEAAFEKRKSRLASGRRFWSGLSARTALDLYYVTRDEHSRYEDYGF
jgi:hypothetical protein